MKANCSAISITDVVGESLRRYYRYFPALFVLALLCAIVSALNSYVIPDPIHFLSSDTRAWFVHLSHAEQWQVVAWTVVLTVIVRILVDNALSYKVYQCTQNQPCSTLAALRYSLSRYWPALLTGISVMILVLVGFALFIIPGVFLMVALCTAMPYVLFDRQSPLQAIKSSFRTVLGNWWRSFAVIVFSLIVCTLISVILLLIQSYAGELFSEFKTQPRWFAILLFALFTGPWLSITIVTLWQHLKATKASA